MDRATRTGGRGLRWAVGLLLFLAAACIWSGCTARRPGVHLYAGGPRPRAEVAALRETSHVEVVAVDGKYVDNTIGSYGLLDADPTAGYRPTKQMYYLLPGPHRIEARFHMVQRDGDWIRVWKGNNAFTYHVEAKAGRVYSFAVETADGQRLGLSYEDKGWALSGPSAVPVVLEAGVGEANRVVARADAKRRPAPASSEGLTTIAGSAFAGGISATGLKVWLIPEGDIPRAWITRMSTRHGAYDDYSGSPQGWRWTIGYGLGHFEFADVAPGDYLLYWQAPGDEKGNGPHGAARVRVEPGDGFIENVFVNDLVSSLSSPDQPPEFRSRSPQRMRA